MATIVGGRRARLIRDSMRAMLVSSLTSLGWFDANRQHQPIQFPDDPIDPYKEVKLNSVGIADSGMTNADMELGSNLSEQHWTFYIDCFGESDTLSLDLIRDIADIFSGRFASIGRNTSTLAVYDYQQATPPVIAVCQIEDVAIDRVQFTNQPWQQFWYVCSFRLIDLVHNDEDS